MPGCKFSCRKHGKEGDVGYCQKGKCGQEPTRRCAASRSLRSKLRVMHMRLSATMLLTSGLQLHAVVVSDDRPLRFQKIIRHGPAGLPGEMCLQVLLD